jgi:hypothetical protein
MAIPKAGRAAPSLVEERVRAIPAIAPQVSMMIGATAIGLGMWGALFPNSVKRTLGVASPPLMVRALFGARELWTGFTLTANPTRVDALWARVAGDFADLAILKSLSGKHNPQRGAAKFAFGAVVVITTLDILTAARMSTVKRTCP